MRLMVPSPAPRMMIICCSVRTGSSVGGKVAYMRDTGLIHTRNTCTLQWNLY